MSKITLFEGASPGTPSSGQGEVYFSSSDKKLHVIDDAGLDTALGGGGGGSTPYIVDAGGSTAYSTVQTAIDDAHSAFTGSGREQVVVIRPGTYTENLTFKPGVGVMGLAEYHPGLAMHTPPGASPGTTPSPATVIIGEHVITETPGVIAGSVSNLCFKQPAAPVNSPASLVQYGTGGAPTAGLGSFQFINVLFDQSAGTFDEMALFTNPVTAVNDVIAFSECVFYANTPTTRIEVIMAYSGSTGSDSLKVNVDRCVIKGSWHFDATRQHDALLTVNANAGSTCYLNVSNSFVTGARLNLAASGGSIVSVEGSEFRCGESGRHFASSASNSNSLFVDDTTIKVNVLSLGAPAYAINNPVRLELGVVSVTGYTDDIYPPGVNYVDTHARINRGAHEGTTLHVTGGGGTSIDVPTHATMVTVDTSAATGGAATVNLPAPAQLQGQILCVADIESNASSNAITVRLDSSASETIVLDDQVATYMSVEKSSGGWIWMRISQLKY